MDMWTMSDRPIQTRIATSDADSITVRGRDLTEDLMGVTDFGEFFYLHLTGELPDESEQRLFNAMLVAITEHGITPSVIAARLTYDSAPESVQGAVASGLLGAGQTFLGSMENAAEMVQEGVERIEAGEDAEAVARDHVERYDRLPGFGHPEHGPVDPRTERLFELLDREGFPGDHRRYMRTVQDVAAETYGSRLLINATGAIGVGVSELGLNPIAGRGIALVARSAGLVGHLTEEMETPVARDMWAAIEDDVEYQE